MIDLRAIARHYGGTFTSGNAVIPTPGHSSSDRGTAIMLSATAPDGLLVHCHNGSQRDALAVKDMLRRDGFLPPRGQYRTSVFENVDQAATRTAEAKTKEERLASIFRAQEVWKNTIPVAGTVAVPYLSRFRGIMPPYPPNIRFQRLHYDNFGLLPCLVAAATDGAGIVTGVQRIWLAPNGMGKANVPQPKRSLGIIKGSAIRFGDQDRWNIITVCEGPEDGLSLFKLLDGLPVWVAVGASFMPALHFPPHIMHIIIAADNDATGKKFARKAADAFADRGLRVRIMHPFDGCKDFNDQLRKYPND
jgi:DNA primase